MGDNRIMLQCGGWEASMADLQAVPAPEQTKTHHPIRHDEYIERIQYELPRFGLECAGTQFALSHEGKRMFAVIKCARMADQADYGLVIGARNSYDKSIAPELVAGTQVFICDNLAFHGESRLKHKSTLNLYRDLPVMIYKLLEGLQSVITRTDSEVKTWKETPLDDRMRDHVLVETARQRGIPWSAMPKVLALHKQDDHIGRFGEPGRVWSYFNAFTSYAKDRSPAQQMEETRRVSQIFRMIWPPHIEREQRDLGFALPPQTGVMVEGPTGGLIEEPSEN